MARQVFVLLLSITVFTACVSKGKYTELANKHSDIESDLAKCEKLREAAQARVSELEVLSSELERQLGTASSNQENMRASLNQMKLALKELSEREREAAKRINEYSDLVKKFQSLTDAGELSIKIVDGRMVVALPSDVLFGSGSANLSDKGKETIAKVAKLLVGIKGKKYQVEGHTDNIPIRTSAYPSNWELAMARALNVLKTMVDAGLPSERVSAASFGETKPFAENDSPEGRQLNRRIEVVVMPDLSTLPGYEQLQKLSEAPSTTN